jgi:RNA polymerase sigma-70 factor (ECF subfamily)
MFGRAAEETADTIATQVLMRQDQAIPGPASPETIEELFEALESPLLAYALRLVGERGLAEDIVQEAFMRLHSNFAEVREPRRWLYRTAHNLALNQRRAADKIVQLAPAHSEGQAHTEAPDPQPLPDEQIVRLEGIGLVRLSLQSLDERSRELLRLKFHENLSYKEIASRTGLTIGHVGYLLHHAIKTVAGELAKNGIVP